MEYALRTMDLCKTFGSKTAVDHVSINIKRGDIYGFIGRNGAGKSTTLKMACGLVRPTSGTVEVFGSSTEDETVSRRVGVLIEQAGLYPNKTARENLILRAMLLGLPDYKCVDEVLKIVGMENVGKKKVRQFSMGMKQRTGVAMALLGNPDLLLLDEPMNGLDPEGIRDIRNMLLKLNQEHGKTIVISSHILGELSKIATRYGIIKDGRLIQQVTRDELQEQCREYILLQVDNANIAASVLEENLPGVEYEIFSGDTIHIYGIQDSALLTNLMVEHKIEVRSIHFHSMDLEEYFLNLMEGGKVHV